MGIFERFLTIWVALAITAGVALGIAFPQVVEKVALLEIAHINLPVAVLIWLMIYPMMIQIDWSAHQRCG
ncbi:arsenite efflux pump ACR3 [Actinobacillus pleuropneumoniae]|uniref:Arsenite transporter, ACR3 family protein n=1 Tax=Actinobacillus pleuropneumoniae serovar 6 str. Femo TaxID=754256 RepID=A0A828Q4P7_ACTPL|nr:truncated arsenite efflux pump ACR3 [Actinobacillus pleuropneumoniae serovar 6 str. Femo]EFM91779.1 arsenite transporter, ACR3 family protein [Actinobacillus pleuropneumoniae serovar 6 str. Femo]SUU65169.1 arsenite efflux pump ACR3 [Actinobacillus pleuropneumoniae]